LLKSIQVLNGQFHRSATRERPPDVAGHAAGEPLASIVDLNERLFALTAVVGRLARPFLFCARTETLEGGGAIMQHLTHSDYNALNQAAACLRAMGKLGLVEAEEVKEALVLIERLAESEVAILDPPYVEPNNLQANLL
jgi:hypothetical protein